VLTQLAGVPATGGGHSPPLPLEEPLPELELPDDEPLEELPLDELLPEELLLDG
jgi:hypothetical protein